jgi:hypothetical protein
MTKACLFALLSLLAGCDELDNCPEAGDPKEIPRREEDTDPLFYESAPWGGPLTPFPPDTDMHFIHNLGHTPTVVKTYLAFSKDGTSEGDVTENAGNQARIQCVDAERIVIENDTCEEDFHIRVVAISSGNESSDISCRPK